MAAFLAKNPTLSATIEFAINVHNRHHEITPCWLVPSVKLVRELLISTQN
jgi:hypothetical protein